MAIYLSCALCWTCALFALNELNAVLRRYLFLRRPRDFGVNFCRFAQRFDRFLFSELAMSHLLTYAAGGAVLARYARVASSRKIA